VRNHQWTMLGTWLESFAVAPGLRSVAADDAQTLDDWLAKLHAAGYAVYASSGTSGKCSLMYQSPEDEATARRMNQVEIKWATGVEPGVKWPVFLLTPSRGFQRVISVYHTMGEDYGRPGQIHWLSDEPLLMSDLGRMGDVRAALSRGAARPSELRALEEQAASKAARVNADIEKLVDALIACRHEPVMICGIWSRHFRVMSLARERGFGDGFLHPQSVVQIGGGTKGVELPADYQQQVRNFYGIERSRYRFNYGMSELVSGLFPACSASQHHIQPWIVPLALDKDGQKLLEPRGTVKARAAFFDLTSVGRWGGIISSDQVTFHFGPCPCGRRGPSVSDITRFADLKEEDEKLSCAGTIEAYVRGGIAQ
jgi:hypothetical protein